ncbi:hypothetical protein [Inquilinus limosus]|uniref:Uncharacterized protein n=1 Tax=Inquilinus limosus MP06 TaxID=1398085 RepID=A0A0A0DD91_9PROT|nr:hypothetical protein [Inquilinus limosus]KGM36099.1 hypothetical protein P409_00160 [Inquilinus limosus MP06]
MPKPELSDAVFKYGYDLAITYGYDLKEIAEGFAYGLGKLTTGAFAEQGVALDPALVEPIEKALLQGVRDHALRLGVLLDH